MHQRSRHIFITNIQSMRGEQNKHLDYADTNYLYDARFIHFVLEKIILKLFNLDLFGLGFRHFFLAPNPIESEGSDFPTTSAPYLV